MKRRLHKYVPGARMLCVAAPQGAGVLVFETDAQGRVTRWRAAAGRLRGRLRVS